MGELASALDALAVDDPHDHTTCHHGFRVGRQPDGRWRPYRPHGTESVLAEPRWQRCGQLRQTTRRTAVSSPGVSPVFTVALGSTSRTSAPSGE